ncbi:MAG: glycosyltransferase, partial [Deltaproteobacteria bacterium]
MRLLLVTTERGLRGGEVQLSLCASELSRRGQTVQVAAPPGAALFARLPPGVSRLELSARSDLDVTAALALRRLARGADVVHAFTARAHALALATGRPVVVSRLVGFRAGKGPFGRLKYRGRARFAAVSRQAAGELERAGV